jgi:hypothetical protein
MNTEGFYNIMHMTSCMHDVAIALEIDAFCFFKGLNGETVRLSTCVEAREVTIRMKACSISIPYTIIAFSTPTSAKC